IEQLRAVRLRIDRLQLVPLDEDLTLRTSCRGMHVLTGPLPDAGHARERSEVLQCVDAGVGLRVDVGGELGHRRTRATLGQVARFVEPFARPGGQGSPEAELLTEVDLDVTARVRGAARVARPR